MNANVKSAYELRNRNDRREGNMPVLNRYLFTGRRTAVRRDGDREKSYQIDTYGPKALIAALIIVSLSILDALFTLFLIDHGAIEANPVMDYYLDHGPLIFFGMKYLLTSVCLLFILVIRNLFIFKTRIRVKVLLVFFMISFALVVKWELYLVLFVV